MQFTVEEINTRLEAHRNSEVSTQPTLLNLALLRGLFNKLPVEKRQTAYLLIDSKSYATFLHDDELTSLFEPISLRDAIAAGHLGVLMGADVFTDAFHHPEQKKLPAGRIYVMAADGTVGYGAAVE